MKNGSTSKRIAKSQSDDRRPKKVISPEIQKAWDERDRSLDDDPDSLPMPPLMWARGVVGKYYKPIKQQITARIDADVIEWLKSEGGGHLTKMNEILRKAMTRAMAAEHKNKRDSK
jgi:uncharacterized protein (DUF4415 family)